MPPNTVRQLQKKLYHRAKSEAQEIGSNSLIIDYSKKFEKSLPSRFKKIEREDFFSNISDAEVVLYGDFHTLKQSQKGFVHLIQELAKFHPTRRKLIAMEAFKVSDQQTLEAFVNGRITERTFLQRIDYDRTWGFPWQNYRRIIAYAAAENIPVFGINGDVGGQDKLAARDKFCAETLARLAAQFRGYQIFCLVGEYHLADQLLPALFTRYLTNKKKSLSPKTVRVVSNIDQYYFSLNFPSEFIISHYLYLKKNMFCIMDTPPWVKWQSYTFWEEQRDGSPQLDAREGLYNEIKLDLDYYILSLVSDLRKFFNFPDNPAMLTKFHLISGIPEKIIAEVRRQDLISACALKSAVVRLALDGFYYVEESRTILMAKVSLNNLSELAGQFLYDSVSRAQITRDSKTDFYQRVVRFSLGILCSKIINPKRKLTNYYRYVDIAAGLGGTDKHRREVAGEIIRFHKWMTARVTDHGGYIPRHLTRTINMDEQVDYEISKSLGKVIGVRLYRQALQHSTPPSEIKAFFQSQMEAWEVVANMYAYFTSS